MVRVKPIVSPALLFCLLSATASCRDPVVDEYYEPPDAGKFEPSTDDDAGPGSLCHENSDSGSDAGAGIEFNNAYSPYLGGEESIDLTVSYFASFQCSHCAHFAALCDDILSRRPDIGKRVRFYFHNFPLFGETAWKMHAAAAAAHNQSNDAFWKMHDFVYDALNSDNPVLRSSDDMVEFADKTLKLDMNRFNDDMNSNETTSFLTWDAEQGTAAGVTGTPSVFVCGEKIVWENIEQVLDGYLSN